MEQVEEARRLARESRSSLKDENDPKYYDYTEGILRCDILGIERQERQIRRDLKRGRISSASWENWQGDLLAQKRRGRELLSTTIEDGQQLRRKKKEIDSDRKRHLEDASIELLLARFDKAATRPSRDQSRFRKCCIEVYESLNLEDKHLWCLFTAIFNSRREE